MHLDAILGNTHTHTHFLSAFFCRGSYKHEGFPHSIIYSQRFIWALKRRPLESSLATLHLATLTYLCRGTRNTDSMLILFNLYFLHVNLTSLEGTGFQNPLQICTRSSVDPTENALLVISIPTPPQPSASRRVGSRDNTSRSAPLAHKDALPRPANVGGMHAGNELKCLILVSKEKSSL